MSWYRDIPFYGLRNPHLLACKLQFLRSALLRLTPARDVFEMASRAGRFGKQCATPVSQPSNSIGDKNDVSINRGKVNGPDEREANPVSVVVADITPHSLSQGKKLVQWTPLG